jgi:hypothetical protein
MLLVPGNDVKKSSKSFNIWLMFSDSGLILVEHSRASRGSYN